jgi:hypothetical protein
MLFAHKKGKATGPDNVALEAFMYGGSELLNHITKLLNACVIHCHLPAKFMNSVLVPIVKNKNGDLTDANNYRAIALSNSITKIFESVLLPYIVRGIDSDYQFGFKAGLSTTHCIGVFKQVVQYYKSRGSHVFSCFVDFTKAFDKINYWKLFNNLLDDGVDVNIVHLIAYWYSSQQLCVR